MRICEVILWLGVWVWVTARFRVEDLLFAILERISCGEVYAK